MDAATNFSPTEKCGLLLSRVDFFNPEAFHSLLEILRSNPALSPFADMLEWSHGKSILVHGPDFGKTQEYVKELILKFHTPVFRKSCRTNLKFYHSTDDKIIIIIA